MKKKQTMSVILTAGILALAPCTAAMTAFADATTEYTITVNESTAGYTYTAYQIFKGDISEKDGQKVLANLDWAEGVDGAAILAAAKADNDLKAFFTADVTDATGASNKLKAIGESENKDKLLAKFAKIAKKNAGAADGTIAAQTDSKYPLKVTGSGYYLVEETGIPTANPEGENEVYSRFMLDVVAPMEVTPKRTLPTLDKKISGPKAKDDGKANGVSIGDTVNYEIRTTMPDLTGYEKYYYVINDTMAAGLTFDPTSVVIMNGTKTLTAGTDYVVQVEDEAGDYTFQIVFLDFVNKRNEAPGSEFVVTYNAVLNEKADRTTAGNLNTADLTYSNNPNYDYDGTIPTGDEPGDGEPTGTTPDKQTKTYTANIKLTKKDNEGNTLTGAKFRLTGTAAKVVLINGTAFKYSADDSGTYYKLTDGTFTETAPTDATADKYVDSTKYALVETDAKETSYENICKEAYVKSDGTLEFNGLAAGTYTLTELVAPEGFNKLENPITVVISDAGIKFEKGAEDPDLWTATVDLDGEGGEDPKAVTMGDTATAAFDVVNNPGDTLPSTGGIGTKLFYLFGGMLAVGSGVLLVTKKRMGKAEQ
ncbi:MAG: isopeptide-forming domain-containing fimbrial protein [Oscillospiraceae bacterium]|nr:isopeptide-forming domain-containing fimbrial protein [Oscillospiraceae bacterium]